MRRGTVMLCHPPFPQAEEYVDGEPPVSFLSPCVPKLLAKACGSLRLTGPWPDVKIWKWTPGEG